MRTNNTAMAVLTVIVSVCACLVPMMSEDASEAASGYWTYTLNYDSSKMNSSTESALSYEDSTLTALSNTSTTLATATTTGSWGWDGEFGPFGSFYAVFGSDGVMKGHLNPNNLTQYADGSDASSDIKTCNVMWCLPTIYISSTDTTLTLSNDPSSGTAYAHTIDGQVWNYLAIGVYEGTTKDGKLMSISDSTPSVSQTRPTFRTQAAANTVDQGDAMLWNYYQWQLYKMCAYMVLADFDSQRNLGQGSVSGNSGPSTTGATNTLGPYAGNVSGTTSSVKLFVENAWGSVYDFVDDVIVKDRVMYAGQRGTVDDVYTNMTATGVTLPDTCIPGSIYTTAAGWGMGKASGGSDSTGLCDYTYSSTGERLLHVGGSWSYGSYAGVGYASGSNSLSNSNINFGARLAYVFAADPAAVTTYNLTFEANGGSGVPVAQTYEGAEDSHDFTIAGADTVRDGYEFLGWSASQTAEVATYATGAIVTLSKDSPSLTLYAVWKQIPLQITSTPSASGALVNTSWNYTLTANCQDFTVSVSGVDWLQTEQKTVFGVGTAVGEFPIVVTISKEGFESVSQELTVVVASVLEYTSEPTGGLIVYERTAE